MSADAVQRGRFPRHVYEYHRDLPCVAWADAFGRLRLDDGTNPGKINRRDDFHRRIVDNLGECGHF